MTRRRVATIGIAGVLVLAALYGGRARLSGRGFGTGPTDNCRLLSYPTEGGVLPLRAECDWALDPAQLHALLADFSGHARIFRSLTESTIVGRQDDAILVRQIQEAGGIAPRAVVVAWSVREVPNGRRYEWRKAPDQSAAAGRGVEVERYDGFWEVTAAGNGAHVACEVRYGLGGGVPAFLVRAFQPGAVRAALDELRGAAEGQTAVARRS